MNPKLAANLTTARVALVEKIDGLTELLDTQATVSFEGALLALGQITAKRELLETLFGPDADLDKRIAQLERTFRTHF